MNIAENLINVQNQITKIAQNCERNPNSIKLLAVSKFHSKDEILQTVKAGQFLYGENRVQEATQKFLEIINQFPNVNLHIIGQLQSNKVKNAVQIASCIESVDSLKLLEKIEHQCSLIDKKMEVLFEYHTAEDSKSGFTTENELFFVLEKYLKKQFPHIIVKGFMTMAPFTNDEKLIRNSFSTLRNLLEKSNKEFSLNLQELSMGMSNDYKIAIEEGSTIVRIGTSIFGQRNY